VVQRRAAGLLALLACCAPVRAEVPATGAAAAAFTLPVQLAHAAYHVPGVPSAIVHAAAGFDPHAPLALSVFLHGYSCCVPVLFGQGPTPCREGDSLHEGWDLARFHDDAHVNSLLVVPQLAFMKRDGRPGSFGDQGGFRAFLEELLRGELSRHLGGARSLADVARVDLIVHSGGYHTALAIMEHGGLPRGLLRSVVLFDALYGETPRFARYVEEHASEGLQFVVVSLPNATPERESRVLLRRLREKLGAEAVATAGPSELAQAVAAHAIVIAEGTPPHRLVPATHLAEVLRALHRAHPTR
jgi:hypothetical protein